MVLAITYGEKSGGLKINDTVPKGMLFYAHNTHHFFTFDSNTQQKMYSIYAQQRLSCLDKIQ